MPIQYAYKDREIEIVVSDAVDETDYFLGTDANRTRTVRQPYASPGCDKEHRMVYKAKDEVIFIASCKFHY